MPTSPQLSAAAEGFLAENQLCTFTTLRPDGSPHVTPVRFTWDGEAGLARVMTAVTRRKARNVLATPGGRASLCQTVGGRWLTLEGTATVHEDPLRVQEGVRRYAKRYWSSPPEPPGLVVIEIQVDKVMGLI
ncbi:MULTISPECIES: PPOX class F420-dependent oxidoreductase [Streptomyces]|uniref:Pyridoxamine 5'-phosphate oxidase n=1 Tax=Streptomyces sviceus (strain ATCC 29083 / DSM 924 / JCM 4929 / NBRC 13980 / NCIMB 11184 / NRRL 5439 / UC 5370) TaxID=463191 RepID=B5HT26_STRX2|nr:MULTISPECIES: PPOX class F420-dependent oxidoreductase [Streptomyces]EDY55981.1 pyridoxamine 5'-phosphate oxidase [Streptomyces sviceus ATCC 29083]MYT08956.1 TIGR03618 family F420-dependent PPOX class oxidoreductase [Streptomyces sp. SID5470]